MGKPGLRFEWYIPPKISGHVGTWKKISNRNSHLDEEHRVLKSIPPVDSISGKALLQEIYANLVEPFQSRLMIGLWTIVDITHQQSAWLATTEMLIFLRSANVDLILRFSGPSSRCLVHLLLQFFNFLGAQTINFRKQVLQIMLVHFEQLDAD